MTADRIKDIIRCGETSTVQFKLLFRTAEDVANELVAFSNSRGGSIFVGINDKTGEIVGLDFRQIQTLGSLVASAADDRIHPVVYPEIESVLVDGKAVMIITVPKGGDAPYTNKKGEIYVKQGCDKRRVTDNNEILRLCTDSGTFQPDCQSIRGTSIRDIDTLAVEDFFERSLHRSVDNLGLPVDKALKNLFVLDNQGQLTLAGLMYFGKRPQQYCPAFNIKAVWFYGNSIGGTEYRDSKDILGTIPEMFTQGLRFIESCLHRRQENQNFNSIGILEIPEVVLSEILQNALVHRSWLKPAPIRILIFDNRVEIVSPGSLPPTLTVDDIKLGNAFQRNQLIANFCAKTMDYRGLGSGIVRALQAGADIEFHNEVSGDQFRVIMWRKTEQKRREYGFVEQQSMMVCEPILEIEQKTERKRGKHGIMEQEKGEYRHIEQKNEQKNEQKRSRNKGIAQKTALVEYLRVNPKFTRSELAALLNIHESSVQRRLTALLAEGKIRRVGPDKGGHWEVL